MAANDHPNGHGQPRTANSDEPLNNYKNEYATLSASLQNLFDSLSIRAAGGAEREAKLLRELTLWKESYMTAEKKSTQLESQNQQLTKQLERSEAQGSVGPPFAAVLIDGDGLIFSAALLSRGTEGGRSAAHSLRERVRQLLAASGGAGNRSTLNVIVNVYFNKQGLGNQLVKSNLVTWQLFDRFYNGFTTAHELNSVVDVGYGKEATDSKVREFLRLYVDMPQCRLVLLGASQDNGYSTVLHSLAAEGKIDKVQILKGYTSLAIELRSFLNQVVDVPGLFMTEKMAGIAVHAPSRPRSAAKRASASALRTTDNELPSEDIVLYSNITQSAANHITNSPADDEHGIATRTPVIDLNELHELQGDSASTRSGAEEVEKVLVVGSVKNLKPRPCHSHYLLKKTCWPDCKWGHGYALTSNQMLELQALVKKLPCQYWITGNCAHGSTCIYGHECPAGDLCTRGEGCRFHKWHDDRKMGH